MLPLKPKDYTRFGFLILLVVILIIISSRFFAGPFKDPWSLQSLLRETASVTFSFVFKSQQLSNIVLDNIGGKQGDYGVYIEDLTDGEIYTLKAQDSFPAASLYKLYLLAAVLQEVEEGRLKMEDRMEASKSYLTDRLGSVDFGYEDAPANIEYEVEEALERVGRISDNFASIMLAEKIGWDKMQQMANSLGTQTTIIGDPISTSAADVALFFKKLYRKEVVSASVSERIVELISLSKINDRLPAGLPEGTRVVHKTGELPLVRHDGGIVYIGDKAYVIVLMSKDLQYEDEAVETLAKISKEVYEYFKSKGGR